METKMHDTPLIWVEKIWSVAKSSQLSDEMFAEIEQELKKISHFLNLDTNQAFLTVIIFKISSDCEKINLNNLALFFDCNTMSLMKYHNDILQLIYKRILLGDRTRKENYNIDIFNSNLKLNIDIPHCIVNNKPYTELVIPTFQENLQLVEFIHSQSQKLEQNDLRVEYFIPMIQKVIESNQQLTIIKKLKDHGIDDFKDIIILSYAMIEYILGSHDFNVKDFSESICESNMEHVQRISDLSTGNHILIKNKMLEKESLQAEWEYLIGENLLKIMYETEILKLNFKPKFKTNEDFLEEVALIFSKIENRKMPLSIFDMNLARLVFKNRHLKIISEVLKLKLKPLNSYILYFLIHKNINKKSNVDIIELMSNVYRDNKKRIEEIDKINSEEHELLTHNLIEINEGGFFGETLASLTELSIDLMKRCNIYKAKSLKKSNITLPENIIDKPLFFNSEDESSINMLSQLLDEEKYKSLHARMKERGLPHGIVALLYGAPGTGKTETVYQLARRHGRPIYKVEISQTKSMWFGESEKRIKNVFKDYQMYCESQKTMPILLFNEADAIIGKRKDSGFSSVSQTENAIQNILLDELERFSGIFIATTNLLQNIDPAFDRRFLFKIEYHQPNGETMANIWKSKLKDLEMIDIEALSKQFPMSGGQIENIVRKIEMQYVLQNQAPTQEEVVQWCMEEINHRVSRGRMGFVVGG
jgi:hypothetical protein